MIKPNKLNSSSKIAIISPSNGLPYTFPGIFDLGIKNLKELLGFEIIEMPTARMDPKEIYMNPQIRANDINQCFKDKTIDGIITSIGGYESVRILPYLDTKLILNNPKFIMGFSDATTFLSYLNYLGMTTFYGPSIMAGFAQMKNLPLDFLENIKAFLFDNNTPFSYKPYLSWTNGYKDWNNPETLGECTDFYENDGWKYIQESEEIVGELWGGCIEVLEFLKSTDYWPDKKFWDNKILFFETSEDKPSPEQVGFMLRNYGMQGIFSKINGIIFGRAKDYSSKEKDDLNKIILEIVKGEFGINNIPIVVDMDFGHTDPKIILPLGGKIKLNSQTNDIQLLETPFK